MDEITHKQMMFEENEKSVLVAYLLWFFFGLLSVHRFYAGKTKSAVIRLIMAFSVILLPVVALLWVIDLFLIPSMIGEANLKTINLINASSAGPREAREGQKQPPKALTEADRKREAMLEDLRQTGYRKERRDKSYLYR